MRLVQDIKDHYYAHLQELPLGKQMHFCTRLAAWDGDQTAFDHLRRLREAFVPEPYSESAMRETLQRMLAGPATGTPNAYELRRPYFEKYPTLRTRGNTVVRVRHLLNIYDIDTRNLLFDLDSKDALLELKEQLLADDDAVRILSTYAINYIYLLERVLLEHTDANSINLEHLYALGKDYNLGSAQELEVYIYFYTHCIINETNFYVRRIPAAVLPLYKQMVVDLEAVITSEYDDIHLDNKLEFLVCCRIVGHESSLEERIYAECEKSVSTDGAFLIDKHNANAQSHRTDLASSEHRNVLYIMSNSPYMPHSTLVS